VISWLPHGDSFVVCSLPALVNVLSKYFRTSNFHSFVRQLNMYNFYKVTNDSGTIQFRHPDFHRDQPDKLYRIKRKNPSEAKKVEIVCHDEDEIKQEMRMLQEKVNELQRAIKTIETQNKSLLEINRDEVSKFFFLKKHSDLKSFRLLFLLHSSIADYYPQFLDLIKEVTYRIGWTKDKDLATNPNTSQTVFEIFTRVLRDFSFNIPVVDRLLQRLIFVFIESVKSNDGGPLSDPNRSRQITSIVNDFLGKFDTENVSVLNKSFRFHLQSPTCRLKGDIIFPREQQSDDQNDSKMFLDLKSENFEDLNRTFSYGANSSSVNDSVGENRYRNPSDFFTGLKATSRHRHK
jgi:hypothetical protein